MLPIYIYVNINGKLFGGGCLRSWWAAWILTPIAFSLHLCSLPGIAWCMVVLLNNVS
jgi:hypothetical protein